MPLQHATTPEHRRKQQPSLPMHTMLLLLMHTSAHTMTNCLAIKAHTRTCTKKEKYVLRGTY